MATWIDTLGQRALHAPMGFWRRVQFGRTAIAATFSVPKDERAAVRAATAAQLWQCGVRQLPLVSFV